MEIDQQIINISNKLEDNYGNEYSEQFNYAIKDIKEKNNIQTIHIMVDLLDLTMDDDHKQKQINGLKKEIKILKEDTEELKSIIKKQNIRIDVFEEDNKILKKEINILMKRHYNLVLWQAYKNLEYYIIKTVTKYDDITMSNINTNLNEFKNDPLNKKYIDDINNLIQKFKINNYANNLGKLNKNRINEAHPDPIELDELKMACIDMKDKYNGIEELYNNYQEVYDFFNILY
jgi:hypothetical protein